MEATRLGSNRKPPSGSAPRYGCAREMFCDDSGEGAERLISLFGTRERSGHVGLEYDYNTSRSVARCVWVAPSTAEIVLRKDLAGIDLPGGSFFIWWSLHSLSSPTRNRFPSPKNR